MTSIKDVAHLANVSIGSVSRFLNEPERLRPDTRLRIELAIAKTGYAPSRLARNFRLGRTGTIVVVVATVGDPFYGDCLAAITRVAHANGFTVQIKEAHFNLVKASDVSDIVVSRQADGLILLGGPSPFDVARGLGDHTDHPPIVCAGELFSRELQRFPSVQIDNLAAGRDITHHVLSLGHRRLAFMRGEANSVLHEDREEGFRMALAAAKLDAPTEYFVYGNLTIEDARRATRQLLYQPVLPTAIICANDEMAIGVMAEIRSNGLTVPGDISVTGFDDIRYSNAVFPRLTTVALPTDMIGERSMYRLLNIMRTPGCEQGIQILPHTLILRDSVQGPKAE